MPEQVKPVKFKYENIDAISQKQFDIHVQLYNGYVNKINEIWNKLGEDPIRKEANATYSMYRGLKKGETYALNGVILHELYFFNMGSRNNNPYGQAVKMIEASFGTYENWLADLIACGKAARGWAILAYDQRSKSLHNFLSDTHDEGPVWNAFPILIMDVYEHAYYIDYANKKDEYIERFVKDINWDTVNNRINMIK